MGRKVAPVIQCYRKMYKVKKVLETTNSALVRHALQQEYDDLNREINHLQERVGMTDGQESTIHTK